MKIASLALFFLISSTVTAQEVTPKNLDLTYTSTCDTRNNLATLSFVGDILIHKMLYQAVVNETKHFAQIWKRTDGLITKSDFSAANLEGPAALGINSHGRDVGDIGFVYDGEVYSGTKYVFNFHPRVLQDLKQSGYDLLTLANNHTFDRHSIGVDKTIIAARQAGIATVGTKISQERNGVFHQIVTVKGIRIAYLGCTALSNKRPPNDDQLLFCYTNETINLIKEISARPDIDATIVLTHWGKEYVSTPNKHQQAYAKKYLEAGAIAVIGSHPHVMQPWEKYITKDGRETFISYSLGNFIAGQAGLARKTGAVVYLGLSKEGQQKAKIVGVGYTPTYREGFELYPVSKLSSPQILKHAAGLFGFKNRVEPESVLLPALCNKNR